MEVNEAAAQRCAHFEERARSIDAALASIGATRVLEIGSGFSFRGLAQAQSRDVDWLDSDLPDVIAAKHLVLGQIAPRALAGRYSLRALDALDEADSIAAARELSNGPFAIVNEGLLMYLDDAEKRRLAATIRRVLVERKGAWVTADIYVRTTRTVLRDERSKRFAELHGIDAKKFATFEDAEKFFVENGLRIDERQPNEPDRGGGRATWILRPEE